MAALGLLLLARPAWAGPADGPDRRAAHAAYLSLELAAARTGDPYLVLDAAAGSLTMRRHHVDLLTIPLHASLGAPRWTGAPAAWPQVRFSLAAPPAEVARPRVTPPRHVQGDTTMTPPLTVEAIQQGRDRWLSTVPAHYRLRFDPDLDVVVVGEESPASAADHWRRTRRLLGEAWLGFTGRLTGHPPRPRLLLVTDPAAARRLYLALGPDVTLLVAPPGLSAPGTMSRSSIDPS